MRWWCVLVCCFGILSVMSAQKTDNKGLKKERELLEITGNKFVANDKTKPPLFKAMCRSKKVKTGCLRIR